MFFLSTLFHRIKSLFLHGLFTMFPITVTILIMHFGYNLVARWVAPLRAFAPKYVQHVPGIEFAMVLTFIFLVGVILHALILGPLVNRFEKIISKIPLIRVVYSSSKILIDFFNVPNPATAEKNVVLIEFPRKDCYNIAFLLDSAQDTFQQLLPAEKQQDEYCKVFMPNSPNPTTGFFLLVKKSEIIHTDISFEDAIKVIISCGIYTPESLKR